MYFTFLQTVHFVQTKPCWNIPQRRMWVVITTCAAAAAAAAIIGVPLLLHGPTQRNGHLCTQATFARQPFKNWRRNIRIDPRKMIHSTWPVLMQTPVIDAFNVHAHYSRPQPLNAGVKGRFLYGTICRQHNETSTEHSVAQVEEERNPQCAFT